MAVLSSDLRRQLERTVVAARDVAESGARVALEALAVGERESYGHMGSEARALRRRLRAHARQLGDRLTPTGEHGIERLVRECAYEHWHAMLFACFLAENDVLIEPDTQAAVTLDECEELGAEEGADKWVVAARFAQGMLPQVFRPDHPVFGVVLAREYRQKLEGMVESLPSAVFKASDALGWVYQFWQSENKDKVNRAEVKIGADELPAVTQLFTEPYMVQFLLDNTLGAWWVAHHSDALGSGAASEEEMRRRGSIPGIALDYLRFVRAKDANDDGPWRPAAGNFDQWPEQLRELKVIDPCCGSGHFLVAVFAMLVPMRMAMEGLNARDAVDAVLRENLHGLELDARCVELAVFALALAAWTWPGAGGYRLLPELNIACSGLSVGVTRDRWTALASGRGNLRTALGWMYDAFRDAPLLGSLLNPATTDAAKVVDWPVLSEALNRALVLEQTDEEREAAVAAQGLAKAAELLAGRYHWVVTNVPYLARGRQVKRLQDYCDRHYSVAKRDLATVFLERCLDLCSRGGTASLVLPQNWLFLASYRKLRENLLQAETWRLLARLGPGAFETISGEVVKAILIVLTRHNREGRIEGLFGEPGMCGDMCGLDVSVSRTPFEKSLRLRNAGVQRVEQARQLGNPDARVTLDAPADARALSTYAAGVHGFGSKDSACFFRQFWEIDKQGDEWSFLQTTVRDTAVWHGCEQVVFWQRGAGILAERGRLGLAVPAGRLAWGRSGVAVSQMRNLPCALYAGDIFDKNVAVISPQDPAQLPAIWCFSSSSEYNEAVRRIDQKLNVTNSTLVKVPFDLKHWTRVANEQYPNGLPEPYSDDPTQWIFHGHPCGSVVWDETSKRTVHGPVRTDATVLQVAVARLLGYRWPAEQDADMELADEQREWARRCETLEDFADDDGIVCIPSVRGEPAAADRLLRMLAAAFGDAWAEDVLARLLAEAGSRTLHEWLRDRFFQDHCKLFHHRPFIWHIWDGHRDGFHVLVNYHKLFEHGSSARQLLESLTYAYLGDWITRQQDGVSRGEGGAEGRLTAALVLRHRLELILEGERPFDIFVRWKPIEEQLLGWAPDVNDGVRLNIRPFMIEDIAGGKRGAGVLRGKPNIHWRKDRGKEPFRSSESFPWFWRDGEFTAERINDIHLPLKMKEEARHRSVQAPSMGSSAAEGVAVQGADTPGNVP